MARLKAADYQKHKKKRDEAARSWALKNPERSAEIKRMSRLQLSEAIRERRRERYASDPFYKATRQAERVRRKRSRVKMNSEEIRLSRLYRAVISEDPCFYCGTTDSERFHVDHYVPINLGGTDHWWNLVQACADCNLSKYDSMPLDFIDRIRKRKTAPNSP
ncbi:HNH endonuclease [Nocardiopsis deserti]|uniref:HNH endonuclease n=1 Tax=Nocardiopsis deserti TaxID=2605988 RepID=UPI0016813922|nr:HNH endonuclease [Nocardiopsis deserti]